MAIFIIIICGFFLDAILLPSFFNFPTSSLLPLLLIANILYFGINKRSIIIGCTMAFLVEVVFMYNTGIYITSFLSIVLLIFSASKFLNLPSLKSAGVWSIFSVSLIAPLFNYIFFFVFTVMLAFINGSYSSILPEYSTTPTFLLGCVAEMFLILYAFKFLEDKLKNDI